MPKRIMHAFKINEISAVDRPAQEGAKMTILKRDFSQSERDHAASSGAALPDGSFPIENAGDLENAVRAIGRAKDPGKARAHIISRAKSLGLTSKLPDDWTSKNLEHTMTLEEAVKQIEALGKSVTDLTAALKKSDENGAAVTKKLEELEKAAKKPGGAAEDAADGGADDAEETDPKAKKRFAAALKKAVDEEEILKVEGAEIRKSQVGDAIFSVMKAQQASIVKAREEVELASLAKRAETEIGHLPGTSVEKAKILKTVLGLGKEQADEIVKMLKAGDTAMKMAMTSTGHGHSEVFTKAEDEMDQLAKKILEKNSDGNMTYVQAYAAAMQTPRGRELYTEIEKKHKPILQA